MGCYSVSENAQSFVIEVPSNAVVVLLLFGPEQLAHSKTR